VDQLFLYHKRSHQILQGMFNINPIIIPIVAMFLFVFLCVLGFMNVLFDMYTHTHTHTRTHVLIYSSLSIIQSIPRIDINNQTQQLDKDLTKLQECAFPDFHKELACILKTVSMVQKSANDVIIVELWTFSTSLFVRLCLYYYFAVCFFSQHVIPSTYSDCIHIW